MADFTSSLVLSGSAAFRACRRGNRGRLNAELPMTEKNPLDIRQWDHYRSGFYRVFSVLGRVVVLLEKLQEFSHSGPKSVPY